MKKQLIDFPDTSVQRAQVRLVQGGGGDAAPAMLELLTSVGDPIVTMELGHVRRRLTKTNLEDVKQAGYLGFVTAAWQYDPDGTADFHGVAIRRVRDGVLKEAGVVGKPDFKTVPLLERDEDVRAADSILDRETTLMVREFVKSLTPLQQAVVKAVFWDGYTQAEVARARGISRAAVTRILQRVYDAGRIALSPLDSKEVMLAVA